MEAESSYIELISGRRGGLLAVPGRGLLRGLSWGYGGLIRLRNRYYDRWALPAWLAVPVISVGNLTVGGTGKTPMALWLCRRLLERGLKPAVLSRGYKASQEGLADELLLISRRCPEAVAVAHANRIAAGHLAVNQYGVQVAVLDDGFQHRRLGRDLDLVLVDATRPFGYGHLLPRGLLREPIRGLQRADAVVVTRCDQCPARGLADLDAAIRGVNPQVPVVHAVHRPTGFADLAGRPVHPPARSGLGCFAGIARPEAFARTLADMNITPADIRWWPDHHVYTPADVEVIRSWAREGRLKALVTTEKDAVKLAALEADWPVPVTALRVEIEMLGDGDRILAELIDTMLSEHEEADVHDHAEPTETE